MSRKRVVIGAGAAVIGAVVIGAVVIGIAVSPWGQDSAPVPEALPVSAATRAAPNPTASYAAVDIPEEQAKEVVEESGHQIAAVLATVTRIEPDGPAVDYEGLGVRGAFLSEVEAERAEFTAEGWTRTGEVTVDSVVLLEYDSDEATQSALVQACVDTTGVTVHRADGERIESASPQRALNIFALEAAGQGWKIIGRSFPDDPKC